MEKLGNGRKKVSPCWFMEGMEKRKLRVGGKDGGLRLRAEEEVFSFEIKKQWTSPLRRSLI